jgi:hypothetical protein
MEIESGDTTLFNRNGNIIKRANDSIQSQNRENLFEDPVTSMDSESGSSQDGRKRRRKNDSTGGKKTKRKPRKTKRTRKNKRRHT